MPIGSDSYPNMIKDWDFLPGMKRWNGQPFYDFARIWWVALVVALGTIVHIRKMGIKKGVRLFDFMLRMSKAVPDVEVL